MDVKKYLKLLESKTARLTPRELYQEGYMWANEEEAIDGMIGQTN